jgi:hypothetical protein
MPDQLDEKAEEIRKTLGLGLSAFYRFAVLEMIKQYQTKKRRNPRCNRI